MRRKRPVLEIKLFIMKKYILIGLVALIILLVVVGFALSLQSKPTPSTVNTQPSFPISTTSLATIHNDDSINIIDTSGNKIQSTNFINNGITIPDQQNPGRYFLAGTFDSCSASANCIVASTTAYNIIFDKSDSSFLISLNEEPLSQSRKNAETFLMSKTGLSETQLCSLNYYLGTDYSVNEQYDSGNLGFSFCPNAVVLP